MEIEWQVVIWSGLIATTVAASFFWVMRSFEVTSFSPAVQLGCLFLSKPRSPATEAVGFLLLISLGCTLVPALYFASLSHWSAPFWGSGALAGLLHGALILLLLPVAGMISACIRAGLIPAPGFFGVRWGWATMGVILLGHVIYGGILGAMMRALMTQSSLVS